MCKLTGPSLPTIFMAVRRERVQNAFLVKRISLFARDSRNMREKRDERRFEVLSSRFSELRTPNFGSRLSRTSSLFRLQFTNDERRRTLQQRIRDCTRGTHEYGGLGSCGKTISAQQNLDGLHVWDKPSRIPERDWRDERDGSNEVGIQFVHVAPFSHVSRFTRHGLWRTFSASC